MSETTESTPKKVLNWREKLDKGLPLTQIQEAQADAEFNFLRRQEEERVKREFEKRKQGQVQPSDDISKKGK